MLDFAVARVLHGCVGPRFLAGDWNFEQNQITCWQTLLDAGWIEVQDLIETRYGTKPRNTCKSKTRKDFLWISPELARHFRHLHFHEVFADHVVMCADFSHHSEFGDRWLWPRPTPIDWTSVPDLSLPVDFSLGAPSDLYQHLWEQKENLAQQTLQDTWRPSMAGRASIRQPIYRKGWNSPLKKSRTQDIQPAFHGVSLQHSRWFKQLRRLESYVRWTSSTRPDRDGEHGANLWRSILLGTGFKPSFASWWISRAYRCPGDVAFIPSFPPTEDIARNILEALYAEVRSLESKLNSARSAVAKHRRAVNPNIIYHDIKKPAALPVETLVASQHSTVANIDVDFAALELQTPCLFDRTLPLSVDGKFHKINHAETDKVWLDSCPSASPGAKVSQSRLVGKLSDVFEAFHEQWKLRWCKHDQVPLSQWQDIVSFARETLPFKPPPKFVVDAPLLRAEIQRKKKTAATGLDGASRTDFLHGGDNFHRSIISMYDRACVDGCWPDQILAGSVSSLAKTVDAETVNQYRPITIFGFAYRCWASLHARFLLDFADSWIHPDIFGNRKGYQAAHLWKQIVHDLEHAYATGQSFSGLTADIEKAYNCLPRWPVFCAALFCGTPFNVLTGWVGAVSNMKRHFRVQDSYSNGFETSTGLAEGCALSCYGMLLIDHLLHRWLAANAPPVRAYSYVDNWDLFTWDPNWAIHQLELVVTFANKVDLTIDRKKTFGWSTDPAVRKACKHHGIQVLSSAKDLGAHLAYTRSYSNSTITARLKSLDDLWPALRKSPSPYALKIRVLKTVAWPRGLHAISSAPVATSVWNAVRSKALQSVIGRKAGVNPILLLGLLEHADPEEFALHASIRDVREFSEPHFMASIVAPLAFQFLDLPCNAPAHILLTRLHRVGLHVEADGLVRDPFGRFSLLGSFQEVSLRTTWAWQQLVASSVSHRPDFAGLQWVDTVTTRQHLLRLDSAQQALYRLQLAGGSLTADYSCHWSTHGKDHCQWCGVQDSLAHRFWSCPSTAHLRTKHAPNVSQFALNLPPAMVLRGWALHAPSWLQWTSLLLDLPCEIPQPTCSLPHSDWVDIFTDGSCLWQDQPSIRIAAWSAIIAMPCNRSWNFGIHGILGSSYLPGLIQTSYRAELYALAYSLHWASHFQQPARIWSDCLGVVNRYLLVVKGKRRVKPNSSHSDHWEWILRSVTKLGSHNVVVTKVAAHQTVHSARSLNEAWRIWNNGAADRVARSANTSRPPSFWKVWQKHATEYHQIQAYYREVVDLHIAVAEFSIKTKEVQPDDTDLQEPRVRHGRSFDKFYNETAWDGSIPANLTFRYGYGLAAKAAAWWRERVQTEACTLQWVPITYLYLDFQLTFGCPGPLKVSKQWIEARTRRHLAPEKFPHQLRVRWFRNYLSHFWKTSGISVSIQTCKPDVDTIQAFVPAVSLAWDPWCVNQISCWLRQHLVHPCARSAVELRSLPLALKVAAMAINL